jgi:hypothetical protein
MKFFFLVLLSLSGATWFDLMHFRLISGFNKKMYTSSTTEMNENPDRRPSIPPIYDRTSTLVKLFLRLIANTSVTAKFNSNVVYSCWKPSPNVLKKSRIRIVSGF